MPVQQLKSGSVLLRKKKTRDIFRKWNTVLINTYESNFECIHTAYFQDEEHCGRPWPKFSWRAVQLRNVNCHNCKLLGSYESSPHYVHKSISRTVLIKQSGERDLVRSNASNVEGVHYKRTTHFIQIDCDQGNILRDHCGLKSKLIFQRSLLLEFVRHNK